MLPKLNRITKTKEFERIFQQGKTVRGKGVMVKFCANELKDFRFGLVVSKKVAKRAVVRNRIRRLISEVIRKNKETVQPGWDVMIIALPGFDFKTESEVAGALVPLLQKAAIMQKSKLKQ